MEVVIASKNSLLRSIVMLRKEVGGARTQLYNSSPFGLHLIHLIHLRCKGVKVHIRQCLCTFGARASKMQHLCTFARASKMQHLCTFARASKMQHLCTCIKDATPLHRRCIVHRASCIRLCFEKKWYGVYCTYNLLHTVFICITKKK